MLQLLYSFTLIPDVPVFPYLLIHRFLLLTTHRTAPSICWCLSLSPCIPQLLFCLSLHRSLSLPPFHFSCDNGGLSAWICSHPFRAAGNGLDRDLIWLWMSRPVGVWVGVQMDLGKLAENNTLCHWGLCLHRPPPPHPRPNPSLQRQKLSITRQWCGKIVPVWPVKGHVDTVGMLL